MTSETVSEARVATPIRALGILDPAGYRLVRDVGSTYRDGAEETLLRIVSEAEDRSADSDEMIRHAKGWAQRYHLDPARANIVRCLDLPRDARVLEIGAGCGAVTRYLGENCAVVDALEPVPARAAVARARTQDLPGVEVVVGELDDIPAVPTYDVVVVVGVLEYVGAGAASSRHYLDFLTGITARLVDGGALVLAIENELGVKYLVGAPEDHSNRVFDSIEGYPRGARARTFSRRRLEDLMRESGLDPVTRTAFPDYKMTRAVLGTFPDSARSLLHRVPAFPSPDWVSPRPKLASEQSLWRRLVEAGLEQEFGNSFLVIASKNRASTLWPDTRAGVFHSVNRRRRLEVDTEIQIVGDGVRFRRSPRATPRATDDPNDIRVVPSVTDYRPGTDLVELVAVNGTAAFGEFADTWLGLLRVAIDTDPGSAPDLVPHNLVVDDDGKVHIIDAEYANWPIPYEQTVRRGIYHLAIRATPLAPPERWAPARTVGEVMVELGTLVGLSADGSWIEPMIEGEVQLLADVKALPPTDAEVAAWRTKTTTSLRGTVSRRLTTLPLGDRLPEHLNQAQAELAKVKPHTQRLQTDLSALKRRLAESDKARKKLESLPEVRAARNLRRAIGKALPRGTHRRSFVQRLQKAIAKTP